jgi:hypothetical protein
LQSPISLFLTLMPGELTNDFMLKCFKGTNPFHFFIYPPCGQPDKEKNI